jgi:hypothetical protein
MASFMNKYVVSDQRSAVSGQRSAVSGQRSAVSGQRSAVSEKIFYLPNSCQLEATIFYPLFPSFAEC